MKCLHCRGLAPVEGTEIAFVTLQSRTHDIFGIAEALPRLRGLKFKLLRCALICRRCIAEALAPVEGTEICNLMYQRALPMIAEALPRLRGLKLHSYAYGSGMVMIAEALPR